MGVMGARFALEVLEVVAAGEVRAEGDAVGLEEVVVGFGSVEDAQDAKGGERLVVNGFASAGDAGGCHDVADGGEERVIERRAEASSGVGTGAGGGVVCGVVWERSDMPELKS
jgi:hypothetical protein